MPQNIVEIQHTRVHVCPGSQFVGHGTFHILHVRQCLLNQIEMESVHNKQQGELRKFKKAPRNRGNCMYQLVMAEDTQLRPSQFSPLEGHLVESLLGLSCQHHWGFQRSKGQGRCPNDWTRQHFLRAIFHLILATI